MPGCLRSIVVILSEDILCENFVRVVLVFLGNESEKIGHIAVLDSFITDVERSKDEKWVEWRNMSLSVLPMFGAHL